MGKKLNRFNTPSGDKVQVVIDEENLICISLQRENFIKRFFRRLINIYKEILLRIANLKFYPYIKDKE